MRGWTGGGGTGIRWAELGVERAESGVEGRNRWWKGSLEILGGKLIFIRKFRENGSAYKSY